MFGHALPLHGVRVCACACVRVHTCACVYVHVCVHVHVRVRVWRKAKLRDTHEGGKVREAACGVKEPRSPRRESVVTQRGGGLAGSQGVGHPVGLEAPCQSWGRAGQLGLPGVEE